MDQFLVVESLIQIFGNKLKGIEKQEVENFMQGMPRLILVSLWSFPLSAKLMGPMGVAMKCRR